MIYVANFTYGSQFKGFKSKRNENWFRIRTKSGIPPYGIDMLITKIDTNKIDVNAFEPMEESNTLRVLYPEKVSVAFDKKTLNAFILSAMKFDADVFIVSIPIGPEGHGDLINHYINNGQLYSYSYDLKNGIMHLIFSLRRANGARLTDTLVHEVDGNGRNFTGITIMYSQAEKKFVINKENYLLRDKEKLPQRDTYMRDKVNVINPNSDSKEVSLRKYFPGRPCWTVILTNPSLEDKVREILAENYHMSDKRLNLVVADGSKELKEKCEELAEKKITAVTYYLAGKKYTSQEVRTPAGRDEVREHLRTNCFGNNFERISVITSDGISSHIDIN